MAARGCGKKKFNTDFNSETEFGQEKMSTNDPWLAMPWLQMPENIGFVRINFLFTSVKSHLSTFWGKAPSIVVFWECLSTNLGSQQFVPPQSLRSLLSNDKFLTGRSRRDRGSRRLKTLLIEKSASQTMCQRQVLCLCLGSATSECWVSSKKKVKTCCGECKDLTCIFMIVLLSIFLLLVIPWAVGALFLLATHTSTDPEWCDSKIPVHQCPSLCLFTGLAIIVFVIVITLCTGGTLRLIQFCRVHYSRARVSIAT